MRDAFKDPTLIVGMHGVLERHPWAGRVSAEFDLDEDVFSLAAKRAEAYGWSSARLGDTGELEGARWAHNDAGGDWTQDGGIREAGWLQVSVAEGPRGQRLPVLPVATVLGDALRRVGRFRLTGLHTLAPLHLALDATPALIGAADWFALADPDGAAELTMTVSGGESGLTGRTGQVREYAERSADGRLTSVEALPAGQELTAPDLPGLALPLTGEARTEGMRQLMAFRCRVREWSPDVAAWTTEILIDALRATGTTDPVLLTVSTG